MVVVRCYAGYKAEESPRLMELEGRVIQVLRILNRWREPGLSGFVVLGSDGARHRLRYFEGEDRWDHRLLG